MDPRPHSASDPHYEPREEMLAITDSRKQMLIGIPREENKEENRIPLVPGAIQALVGHGNRIIIESDAGKRSGFRDHDYAEAGAEIVHSKEEVYKANILIKSGQPSVDEIDMMHHQQVLISPLHLPLVSPEYLNKLRQKRVIALAMEYIQDQAGAFPLVRAMSEIAGLSSILIGAELLTSAKGNGVLLGGISGVPPARVVILGAGVVAEYAARAAMGLGAEVRIFDNNIYKLTRLKRLLGNHIFTSAINAHALQNELLECDLAIGAMHSKSGRTNMVVTHEMVSRMKPGSVIVDVSIDQGGCFETSEITKHSSPIFIKDEVIHYCVPNISSKFAQTASTAISNILSPILLKVDPGTSVESLFYDNLGLRHGVYTYKGCLTNHYLGQKFGIKTTDLELLIASRL